jgi:hypothetical protein
MRKLQLSSVLPAVVHHVAQLEKQVARRIGLSEEAIHVKPNHFGRLEIFVATCGNDNFEPRLDSAQSVYEQ